MKRLKKNKTVNLNQPNYSKNIVEKILDEQYKIITESLGKEDVKNYKNISASLCGRMVEALQKFNSKKEFIEKFLCDEKNGIKGKKAELQLKNVYILEDLKTEFNKLNDNAYLFYNNVSNSISYTPDKEKLYKHYWIAFFKQIRLNAKKEKQNQ